MDKNIQIKYDEATLLGIAKRENNEKRNYLIVNKCQGKHVPTSPSRAMAMFDALGRKVGELYKSEKLLLVGFAETATAIGARIAIRLGALYMQTTREDIVGVDYIFFSEEHSHATEQKLIREDLETALEKVERIVFVEDEISTGKTILNIVNALRRKYPTFNKFTAVSILNGMSREAEDLYDAEGIRLHYLLKTYHEPYGRLAESYAGDGSYHEMNFENISDEGIESYSFNNYMDARRLISGVEYEKKLEILWEEIQGSLNFSNFNQILLVGTEEFMYPALFIGEKLEKQGKRVRTHSTTRSPIAVSTEEDYPLKERYEIRSLYDRDRKTFLYDVNSYDCVLVLTDAPESREAAGDIESSLLNVLKRASSNIFFVRWQHA